MKDELIKIIIPAVIGATISGAPMHVLLSNKSEQLGKATKQIEFLNAEHKKSVDCFYRLNNL